MEEAIRSELKNAAKDESLEVEVRFGVLCQEGQGRTRFIPGISGDALRRAHSILMGQKKARKASCAPWTYFRRCMFDEGMRQTIKVPFTPDDGVTAPKKLAPPEFDRKTTLRSSEFVLGLCPADMVPTKRAPANCRFAVRLSVSREETIDVSKLPRGLEPGAVRILNR